MRKERLIGAMSRHARLPLWNHQTPEEKLETLRQLLLDLYRYQLDSALSTILRMLDAHQPADAKEARDIELIKRLIAEHPNIISPHCEGGHITASALIVDMESGRVLLHFHKRLKRWLQVGGHADFETDFAQVAMREAREETGLTDLSFYPPAVDAAPIDYDAHAIPERGDVPAHLHLDFRYLLVTRSASDLAPASGESTRFRWLRFEEALAAGDDIDDSLKRLLRKGQALLGESQSTA